VTEPIVPGTGDRILIRGFGLSGFRSVANDLQLVGPLSAVNVIAGRNNSGKSNVLRFAEVMLSNKHLPVDELDYLDRDPSQPMRLVITAGRSAELLEQLQQRASSTHHDPVLLRQGLEKLLAVPDLNLGGDQIWIPFVLAGPDGQKSWDIDPPIHAQPCPGLAR